MKKQLMEMLENRKDEMIQIRRYLHENPELSLKKKKQRNILLIFTKEKMWTSKRM